MPLIAPSVVVVTDGTVSTTYSAHACNTNLAATLHIYDTDGVTEIASYPATSTPPATGALQSVMVATNGALTGLDLAMAPTGQGSGVPCLPPVTLKAPPSTTWR